MRKLIFVLLLAPLTCRAELALQDGKLTATYAGKAPTVAEAASAPVLTSAPVVVPVIVSSDAGAAAPSVASEPQQATNEAAKPVWHVEKTDSTFERLFSRWAASANWTLIWDVPQDIPVLAQFTFSGSFTDAVFAVTDSTNGTDLPIHPCFYTNNVMRIVPVSVVCTPENS